MAKVLTAGIDTLNVGFNVAEWLIGDQEFRELDEAKRSSGDKLFGGKGVTVELGGREFIIRPRGTGGYEYAMYNDDLRLSLARKCQGGRVFPEAFAYLNSSYLWGKGYENAFRETKEWLSRIAVLNREIVNRADLCVDLAADLPLLDPKRDVVTRARDKTEYFGMEQYVNGARDTGYRLGSGAVMARIYDKKLEIGHSDKAWFKEIWKQGGWDGLSNVTRTEFQLRRRYLRDYLIDTYDTLITSMPDMWRSLTGEWLVLKRPEDRDTNHRRWETSDFWKSAQGATGLFGKCLGIQRYRQKQAKIEPLMAQMKGLMISVVALDSVIRGEHFAVPRLKVAVNEYLESGEFRSEVQKRRGKYSNLVSANGGTVTHSKALRAEAASRFSSLAAVANKGASPKGAQYP